MANSFADTIVDGSTTIFSVPFGYIDRFHVSVLVDGVSVAFEWINDATVSVVPAPAAGQTVRVRRVTPKDPIVDFRDGENLTEADLDSVSTQALYLAQESEDSLGVIMQVVDTGQYDAGSRRIQNLANPVDAQDAVTKLWAETSMTSNLAQAIAARVAAQAAQAAAEAARDAAQASQTAAAGSASAASASASSASTSAATATTQASTATTKAGEASASASAAAGSAATATTQAGVATTKATEATTQAGIATTKAAEASADAADAEFYAGQVQGNIIPVGAILEFAGGVPSGWLACDGSPVDVLYPELRAYLINAGSPFGVSGSDPLLPNLIAPDRGQSQSAPDMVVEHVIDGSLTGAPGYVAAVAATWNLRPLNTVRVNEITGASLSGNGVSLPAGRYYVEWGSVAGNVNDHVTRIRRTSDNAELLRGPKLYAQTNSNQFVHNTGGGFIDLPVADVIQLDHYTQTANAWGLGINNINTGEVVYASLKIYRIESDFGVPCIKAYGQVDVTGMADLSALLNGIATQAEARAGVDNTKLMTPLRTKDVISQHLRYAILQDQKPNGTASQVATAGAWVTCHLNTELFDPDNLVSISGNEFTPSVGGRLQWARQQRDLSQTRLFNVTDNVVVAYSTTVNIGGGGFAPSIGYSRFEAGKTYRIEIITNASLATPAGSRGGVEVYLNVYMEFSG